MHLGLAMSRKQLNIGLTLTQYEAVRVAAEEEGVTITAYCRQAVMEKAAPVPEVPDVATLPPWLLIIDELGFVPLSTHRRGTPLRGLQPALRAGLHPGHHQPAF